MPVETGTKTGTSSSSNGGSKGTGGGGQNNGLTKGYVGAAGTNKGAWSGDGKNLGLTTGNTIYGNTAYGPAGGMASGYATRDMASLNAAGQGPTAGVFSNFMGLGGQPAFGGALGGMGFKAMNANEAAGMASNYYNQNRQMGPAVTYGAERVQVDPLRPMFHPSQLVPASLTVPRPSFRPVSPSVTGMYGRNPTSYPQFTDGYHRPGNFPGVRPGARANETTMRMNNQGNTAGYGPGYRAGSGFGPEAGDSFGPGTGNRWGY